MCWTSYHDLMHPRNANIIIVIDSETFQIIESLVLLPLLLKFYFIFKSDDFERNTSIINQNCLSNLNMVQKLNSLIFLREIPNRKPFISLKLLIVCQPILLSCFQRYIDEPFPEIFGPDYRPLKINKNRALLACDLTCLLDNLNQIAKI